MQRTEILQKVADKILSLKKNHPIRIGIDGIDGAGKTIFAKSLVDYLKNEKNNVIYSSIDKFHNPKEIRYQKGRVSPQGYYQDQFNYKMLIDNLLKPLGPRGGLEYKEAYFDYITNTNIECKTKKADKNSVLIFDGVFLCRKEIRNYFDLVIFIDVDFDIALSRVLDRQKDKDSLGEEENIRKYYKQKYFAGQELYFKDVNPKEKADIIIDNNDFNNVMLTINT
ncbi:MAG: P-loop NTPase fold protein [Patescibacteria group bacterium]